MKAIADDRIMNNDRFLGYSFVIISSIFFGSTPVISALLRDAGASSIEQTLIRLVFGALISLILIFIYSQIKHLEFNHSILHSTQETYILQGFILSFMMIVYLSAISMGTPVGEAALLIQIHPLITLIFGWSLLREEITVSKITALSFALLGILLLTEPWKWDTFLSSFAGDLLAIFDGFLIAIYLLYGTWSNKFRENSSPELSMAWVLFWGFITGMPVIFFISFLPLPSELVSLSITTIFSTEVLLLGLILALFGSLIPYGLIMISNKFKVESSKTSIMLLGEPIAAMILGFIVLNEEITIWYIIGGLLLITAISFVVFASKND